MRKNSNKRQKMKASVKTEMEGTIRERKKYACSLCIFSSRRKHDLKVHNRVHTGERPFPCLFPECSSSFTQKCNLKIHTRIHTRVWPFSSSYQECTRSFRTKTTLTTHMRIHLGEKPYRCNLCYKTFRQKSALSNHIRVHTGEKPYSCPVPGCRYESSRHDSLVSHQRVHSGEKPFKCPVQDCRFSTARKDYLKEHRRCHSQEKPFKCDFKNCHYSYSFSSSLRRHRRRHFGDKAKAKKPLHSSSKLSRTEPGVITFKSNYSCSSTVNTQLEHPSGIKIFTQDQDPKLRSHAFVPLFDVIKSIHTKSIDSSCNAEVRKHIISTSKGPSSLPKASRIDDLLQDPKLRAHPIVLLTDIQKTNPRKLDAIPEKILDISPAEIQCEIPEAIEVNDDEKENEEPYKKCAEAETEAVEVKQKDGIKFVCKVCAFKTRKMNKYKMHLKEHRERNELFCSLCDFVCFQRTSLMKHWKTHEDEKEQNKECGEFTPVSHANQKIVSTPVNHESRIVEVPPLKVEESVTRTVLPLKEKKTWKDKEQVPLIVTKREFKLYTVFMSLVNNLPSVYFACNLCSKQFAKEMKILNHLRHHTGSMPP